MWQLTRLHLRSIGHPDARFAPLTVDFTDPDGMPTDTVLWLENGGGKTTMLSLAFSVLRPRLDQFLTAKAGRHLHEYVLAGDVAHVALEWSRPERDLLGSRATMVTGQVLAWEELRPTPDDTSRLRRRFYGFRTDDTVTFDALPFDDPDGNPQSLATFCDDLSRLLDGRAHLEPQPPTQSQTQWLNWLTQQQLPPDVFVDQVEINADEGAIAEAFKFADGDEFVRWALRTASDPTVANELVAVIGDVRDRIQRRPALELEQQLCDEAADHLTQLAAGHALAVEASEAADRIRAGACDLAGQLATSAAELQDTAAQLQADAAEQDRQATEANTADRSASRRAVRARQLAAELRVAAATDAEQQARDDAREASADVAAWQATDLLAGRARLHAELKRKDELLGQLDDELSPLRSQLSDARDQLAGAAHARREQQQAQIEAADQATEEATEALRAAQGARRQAEQDHRTAQVAAGQAAGQLQGLDDALRRAVERGLLAAGQTPKVAAIDARQQATDLAAQVDTVHDELTAARSALQVATDVADQARQAQVAADREASETAATAVRMREEAAQLADDPVLQAVTDLQRPDPFAGPARVRTRLAELADRARSDAVNLRVEVADHARIVDAIEASGLAPAPADVQAAVDELTGAGFVAHTGWQFLSESVTADQADQIQRCTPQLAAGIVVDDTDIAAAADHLARWADDQLLFAPLVVTSNVRLLATDAASQLHTVVAHPALHDRDAATQLHGQMDDRTRSTQRRAQRAADQAGQYDRLAARLSELHSRWPDPQDVLDRADTAATRATEAATATSDVDEAVAGRQADVTALEDRYLKVRGDAADADTRAGTLEDLATQQDDRGRLEDAHDRAAADVEAGSVRIEEADTAADAAREASNVARQDRQRAVQALEMIEACCRRADVVPAPADHPAGVDLPALEMAVTELSNQLHRRRDEAGLDAEVSRLRDELADVEANIASAGDRTVERATTLLAGPDGGDPTSRRAATARAQQVAYDAAGRVSLAEQERERAQKLSEQLATQEARPLPDDWDLPDDPAGFDLLAASLESEATSARRRQKAAELQAQSLSSQADTASGRAERLAELADDLTAIPDVVATGGQPPFTSDVSAAEAVRAVREGLSEAADNFTEADGLRRDEHAALAQLVARPEYHVFASEDASTLPIVTQLTSGTAEQVGARAGRYQQLLSERSASIRFDLDEIAEHQRLVVKQLVAVARKALQLLRTLQQRSSMPDGLGGWSRSKFLTVRHDDPPEDEAAFADRMGRIVDRIVGGSLDLDGARLTYEAARAAVGESGFTVRILKPHPDLRRDPVDIAELSGFSGGQRLTAAVALFLAMLNLRLSEAGQTSSTRSVLLLDNPFGKSSADTFVELQCRLASRLNVQLVYTTAVKDLGALSHFHRVVRLTHRQHTGSGRLHVMADERADRVSALAAAALSRRDRPDLRLVADDVAVEGDGVG